MDDIIKPKKSRKRPVTYRSEPANIQTRGIDLDRPKNLKLAHHRRRKKRLKFIGIFLLVIFLFGWLPFSFYFATVSRMRDIYETNYTHGFGVLKVLTDAHNQLFQDGFSAEEIEPALESFKEAHLKLNAFEPSQPRRFVLSYATRNIPGSDAAIENFESDNLRFIWNQMESSLGEFILILKSSGTVAEYDFQNINAQALKQDVEKALDVAKSSSFLEKTHTDTVNELLESMVAEIEQFEITNDQDQLVIQLINYNGELLKTIELLWESILRTELSEFSELVSDNEYILNLLSV